MWSWHKKKHFFKILAIFQNLLKRIQDPHFCNGNKILSRQKSDFIHELFVICTSKKMGKICRSNPYLFTVHFHSVTDWKLFVILIYLLPIWKANLDYVYSFCAIMLADLLTWENIWMELNFYFDYKNIRRKKMSFTLEHLVSEFKWGINYRIHRQKKELIFTWPSSIIDTIFIFPGMDFLKC